MRDQRQLLTEAQLRYRSQLKCISSVHFNLSEIRGAVERSLVSVIDTAWRMTEGCVLCRVMVSVVCVCIDPCVVYINVYVLGYENSNIPRGGGCWCMCR